MIQIHALEGERERPVGYITREQDSDVLSSQRPYPRQEAGFISPSHCGAMSKACSERASFRLCPIVRGAEKI
jgi:hypothetical protein